MGQMKDTEIDQPPTYPPFGLSVKQLQEAQQDFTEYARERIGASAKEYDLTWSQSIEHHTPSEILTDIREEIADAINYLSGLDIILQRTFADRTKWFEYGIKQGWVSEPFCYFHERLATKAGEEIDDDGCYVAFRVLD